ncbi:hypothetical protein TNCV_4428971 [Trichonephila clavipes]|nr:hypothetical protein TNCV_4428971 [Trichonephila clavipes]
MAAVDVLHHENPPTCAGDEPATLGAEGQRQTNHATQPTLSRGPKSRMLQSLPMTFINRLRLFPSTLILSDKKPHHLPAWTQGQGLDVRQPDRVRS